jgi:hypothetical protein
MRGWNKMDFKETGWESVDWIHMAQDRDQWWDLVNMVTNFPVLAPQSLLLIQDF